MVTLPMPGHVMAEGERLPASYANFYIANEVVLMPLYGHANDALAIEILGPLPGAASSRLSARLSSGGWGRSTASRSSNRSGLRA